MQTICTGVRGLLVLPWYSCVRGCLEQIVGVNIRGIYQPCMRLPGAGSDVTSFAKALACFTVFHTNTTTPLQVDRCGPVGLPTTCLWKTQQPLRLDRHGSFTHPSDDIFRSSRNARS